MSKGSRQRPTNHQRFKENYDRIFMSKKVCEVKSGNDVFVIYESLKVGETIHAGDKSFTVKDADMLETLRSGKMPRAKNSSKSAS